MNSVFKVFLRLFWWQIEPCMVLTIGKECLHPKYFWEKCDRNFSSFNFWSGLSRTPGNEQLARAGFFKSLLFAFQQLSGDLFWAGFWIIFFFKILTSEALSNELFLKIWQIFGLFFFKTSKTDRLCRWQLIFFSS